MIPSLIDSLFRWPPGSRLVLSHKRAIYVVASTGLILNEIWETLEAARFSPVAGFIQGLGYGPMTVLIGLIVTRLVLDLLSDISKIAQQSKRTARNSARLAEQTQALNASLDEASSLLPRIAGRPD